MSNIVEEYEQFIRNIKKIVQLRDTQYEELMTTGEYTYSDPVTQAEYTVPKDPDTLYVAPSYSLKWLIQKVYETSVKPFEPAHEPIVLEELSEYVKTFLRERNLNETYVAMRGLFRENERIKYSDDYYLFINGVEYDHDYVCLHHAEYITVLIVAKDKALNLKYDDIHILPEELIVWRNRIPVTLENRLCSSATYVTSNVEESCLPDLRACKILRLTTNETASSNISPELEELYFYGRTINLNRFSGCSYLRKAVVPYTTTVTIGVFSNCVNLELAFPRLISQIGSDNNDVFTGIKSLRLPVSFTGFQSDRFFGNVNTIYLDCINANFTKSFCRDPNANVKHIVLADNWNANLYLHKLTSLDADDMIDGFNKLVDLTGQQSKLITLYPAFLNDLRNMLVTFDDTANKYRRLTDEEAEDESIVSAAISVVDIAENKNWEVTNQ